MKNIAVIFGGVSQEHDVSVITGVFTLNCVDSEKYNAIPVYIGKDGFWYTGEDLRKIGFFKNIDFKKLQRVTLVDGDDGLYILKGKRLVRAHTLACAINCTHGRNGEDGSLSGEMLLHKIPLASPDAFSSSASMDKIKTKKMLAGLGVLTTDYIAIRKSEYYSDKPAVCVKIIQKLDYPVIVKPASSGSSIGISVAKSENELFSALEKAFGYDNAVICERFLAGAADINCAAYFDGKSVVVSECEKPVHKSEFLTFTDKYSASKYGAEREFPAKIDVCVSDEIKETTKKVYEAFGFFGIVRIDYLVCGDRVYLNEINAVPGSLAYYLFCEKTSQFTALLNVLIEKGIERAMAYENCIFDFASDVLSFKGVSLKK